MGKFLSPRLKGLKPYTPGEQPQGGKYIKLNTNESPFPPSPYVFKALEGQAETLRLYPDPENRLLNEAIAENFGLSPENIIAGNGSDE
ncbi:MAG TPA: histidinol-phosphate transaminase, partial [Clostridiales bacterium]|nr:histidinol-phosphate transaminase [Clostridiales bacterium]